MSKGKLALDALVDERGGQRRVERDGDALVARRDVAARALRGDEQIVLRQFDLCSADLRRESAAVLDRGDHRRAVARLQIGTDGAEQFAVFGPERLHLRFEFIGDQRGRVGGELHRVDVELVQRDGAQFFVEVEVAFGRDDHLRERLSVFECACVARRPAEHDDVEHRIHALFEVGIDRALVADGDAFFSNTDKSP